MSHMKPVAEYFSEGEISDRLDIEDWDTPEAGWYSRLSGPGCPNCKDWDGPFLNAFRAIRHQCELHDIHTNGDGLDACEETHS